MTADNKVELIGPIDGDALMKWIEECDLVIHFKPELYIKLRDGDFALVPSPSSGDARVPDLLEIIEYLMVRLEDENAADCDCGTDEPGSCVICRARAALRAEGEKK